MNLQPLFEAQKALDERIIKEKGLEGQDLLPNTILALQVELGELANEWRGFKHWSNNREPRTKVVTGEYLVLSDGVEVEAYKNPLLEEYVDCLHFILSIGLQLRFDDLQISTAIYAGYENKAGLQFSSLFRQIAEFDWARINANYSKNGPRKVRFAYSDTIKQFVGLGEILGFTWEQIEAAYFEKNEVNHQRQVNGY